MAWRCQGILDRESCQRLSGELIMMLRMGRVKRCSPSCLGRFLPRLSAFIIDFINVFFNTQIDVILIIWGVGSRGYLVGMGALKTF